MRPTFLSRTLSGNYPQRSHPNNHDSTGLRPFVQVRNRWIRIAGACALRTDNSRRHKSLSCSEITGLL